MVTTKRWKIVTLIAESLEKSALKREGVFRVRFKKKVEQSMMSLLSSNSCHIRKSFHCIARREAVEPRSAICWRNFIPMDFAKEAPTISFFPFWNNF